MQTAVTVIKPGTKTEQTAEEPKKYGCKVIKEKEELECMLTNDELLAYGEEQARLHTDKDKAEYRKKSFTEQIKQEVTSIEARICSISQAIREKKEYREVPTEIIKDYDAGTVSVIRRDTDVIVRSRQMSESELSERDNLFHKQEVEEGQPQMKDVEIVIQPESVTEVTDGSEDDDDSNPFDDDNDSDEDEDDL